jgi:general secretion pathway protein J
MRKDCFGFTLIELMVALFIFAIVAMLAIGGLRSVLHTTTTINQHNQRLGECQLAGLIMSRDFTQIANRPIMIAENNEQPSLLGESDHIEFTRMGYMNPLAQFPRGTLQRTGYFLKNNQLIRETWPVLDRISETYPVQRVLLSNVSSLRFLYIDNNLQETDQWSNMAAFPVAIIVTLYLKDLGTLQRIYQIPGGNNEN